MGIDTVSTLPQHSVDQLKASRIKDGHAKRLLAHGSTLASAVGAPDAAVGAPDAASPNGSFGFDVPEPEGTASLSANTQLQPALADALTELGLLDLTGTLVGQGIDSVETLLEHSADQLKAAAIKGGHAKRLLAHCLDLPATLAPTTDVFVGFDAEPTADDATFDFDAEPRVYDTVEAPSAADPEASFGFDNEITASSTAASATMASVCSWESGDRKCQRQAMAGTTFCQSHMCKSCHEGKSSSAPSCQKCAVYGPGSVKSAAVATGLPQEASVAEQDAKLKEAKIKAAAEELTSTDGVNMGESEGPHAADFADTTGNCCEVPLAVLPDFDTACEDFSTAQASFGFDETLQFRTSNPKNAADVDPGSAGNAKQQSSRRDPSTHWWHMGDISRQQAEEELIRWGVAVGMFLIRQSGDGWVLSRHTNQSAGGRDGVKISHNKVQCTDGTYKLITKNQEMQMLPFRSLNELVEHCQRTVRSILTPACRRNYAPLARVCPAARRAAAPADTLLITIQRPGPPSKLRR